MKLKEHNRKVKGTFAAQTCSLVLLIISITLNEAAKDLRLFSLLSSRKAIVTIQPELPRNVLYRKHLDQIWNI